MQLEKHLGCGEVAPLCPLHVSAVLLGARSRLIRTVRVRSSGETTQFFDIMSRSIFCWLASLPTGHDPNSFDAPIFNPYRQRLSRNNSVKTRGTANLGFCESFVRRLREAPTPPMQATDRQLPVFPKFLFFLSSIVFPALTIYMCSMLKRRRSCFTD